MLETSLALGLWLLSGVPGGSIDPLDSLALQPNPSASAITVELRAPSPAWTSRSPEADEAGAVPQQDTDLEAYKKALQKTGIEARVERETAVQGLLLLSGREAHVLLQNMLLRGDDPDELSRYILSALAGKWPQEKGPTFGRDKSHRAILIPDYLRVFAAYFAIDERVRPDKVSDTVKDLALSCMRAGALAASERKLIFTALMADSDASLAQGAMIAASQCQDLGLAPVLATHLSGPNAVVAREALRSLTFAETRFHTEAEFQAWWELHRKSYRELAFEAAARGVAAIDDLRGKADVAYTAQTKKLISALLRAGKVEWARIQKEVLEGQPEASRSIYLDTVLAVLRKRTTIDGIAQERLVFAEAMQARYLAEGIDSPQRAHLLETLAYLVPRDASELRSKVGSLLIGALIAPRRVDADLGWDDMRIGALSGLRSYPSDEHRNRMVELGMEAIAGKHTKELEAVLLCLRSRDWHAPTKAVHREAWLAFLAAVFAQLDADVRVELKQSAGAVAVVSDASGKLVPTAFDKLLAVVKKPSQAAILRRQLINRLRAFQSDDLQKRYTEEVSLLLVDPVPEIRIEAATQLKNFPKSDRAADNSARVALIARHVTERFPLESDDRVLAAFVDCLQRMAADVDAVSLIISRLELITTAMIKDAKADDVRKKHLVKLLRNIASADSLAEIHWVLAGEMLVKLGERSDLRIVLGRQQAVSKRQGFKPEIAIRAMRLVVQAGLMLPKTQLWSAPAQKDEASDVLEALAALTALGKPLDSTAVRVLHTAILAGLRRDAEMLPFARKYLDAADLTLSKAEQAAVSLDHAEGLLRTGKATEAAKALLDRSAITAWTPRALNAADASARALSKAGKQKDALPLLDALATKTPADAKSFADRFLRFAETRVALDPEGSKLAVRADLEPKKALFEGGGVSPALKARWDALCSKVKEG